MPFHFERLKIPAVILVHAKNLGDERGYFRENYKFSEFAANGIAAVFVQDNYSHSTRGVVRGLHYQKLPHAQGKLVSVSSGRIWDVAVDIRKGSPTYAHWVGYELSAENGCLLYIPPGFAHGFCVLSDYADVLYKITAEYVSELDRGIAWNDPNLQIEWHTANPILSPKDARLPWLQDADNNFVFGAGL
jgi:dTDP-4-dehydrorhamnose 3,5-epimerase